MMRTTKTGMRDSPQRDDTHSRHISLEVAHHNRSRVHYLDGQEKVSSQGLADATTRGSHQARSHRGAPQGASRGARPVATEAAGYLLLPIDA